MNWEQLNEVKVLVVEDDIFNRMLIKSLLMKVKNIKVVEAKDGLEALSILDNSEIDICLLDLHMPTLNGFETLNIIRNGTTFEDIPVIVITSDEIEKKKSFALGANDFMAKPFDLESLKSKIYQQLIQS
jgi:CheY-like chemotaxis protein